MSESNINLNIDIDKSLKGLTPEAMENVVEAQYKGYWGFVKKHPWIKYFYIIFGLIFLTVVLFMVFTALTAKSTWEKKTREAHEEFIRERDEAFEKGEAEYNQKVKEQEEDFNNRVKEQEEDFNNRVEENLKNFPKVNQ